MAKKIVGIDFEPNAINTSLVTLGKRRHFNSVVSTPITGAIDETGRILDPVAVSECLKEIWKKNRYTTKKVALGIGSSQALVRPITVPEMSQGELKQALPTLVAGLIPVAVENLILDFYPIEQVIVDNQANAKGLLLAAPKESIYALVSTVEKAGLQPASLDLNALSLLRYFAGTADRERNAVYVFASRSVLHLIVTEMGVPSLVRSIPLSAAKSAGDLAAKSFPEYLASQAVADQISREVTQTVQYFQQTHASQSLDLIYLVGISFSEANFSDILKNTISVPVKSIFKSAMSHSSSNKDSVVNLNAYDEYSTAIALAMASGVIDG